jgi:quercetin dioxygenase-like cupin family protein
MTKLRNVVLLVVGCALAGAPMLSAAESHSSKIVGSTLWAVGDLKWVPMPGLKGAQQVPLWGDPTTEAHRILYKWPAGTKVPVHTHSYGDRGIVISGTMTLAVEGASPKRLPPGSYFSMAGGTKHATTCEEDVDCVFFIEREGPFDVKMVEGAGTDE